MNLKKKTIFACLILEIFFSPYSYADEIDFSDNYTLNTFETSAPISSVPNLNSRAAIIFEKSTGSILFGKNENEKRKMASTTKIMTAIVVLENTPDLSEVATVSKKAANVGGSRLGLSTDSKVTINDLLYGLLLCSGNDAATALAEFVGGSVEDFADLMNQKAVNLGLTNTHFVTPHGLDNDEHYTTAYELAVLTKYALENETFSRIVSTKSYSVTINNSSKNIGNTNELLGYLDGVYGVKTGFTNGANRCLVTACKRDDLDIICIVLGADTKKCRTQDSIKLIEYAFSNFEMVDIESIIQEDFSEWKSRTSSSFFVNKGASNSVNTYLETIQYSKYPVNKSEIKNIRTEFSCSYNFEAPLPSNSQIGIVNLYINNVEILELDIYSVNAILKKSPLFYFDSFFKNYSNYLESIFNL
jgi:D-alanyl-D-alanine carboxypeptidase (penicillin-binding protein 5/6)